MERDIKMVVFDMAGTTINENNVVYKTLQKAINDAGFNFTLNEVLAQGAGKEKLQAIKSILIVYAHSKDDKLADSIYANFIVQLADIYAAIDISPQNNALRLFKALKEQGILTVLNTGYNRETAEKLIKKLNWEMGVDFDGLVTATDVNKTRPDPDMIFHGMSQFNVKNAAEVIKVGDSIIDIEEGKNAGCAYTVGITTGAHTYDQLKTANPDFIINDLIDLLPLLAV